MNKSEFADHISKENNCNKAEAYNIINAFIKGVTSALVKEEVISLIGFGNFSISQLAARTGINPKTKEAISISARNRPKFTPGKTFKDICNSNNKDLSKKVSTTKKK